MLQYCLICGLVGWFLDVEKKEPIYEITMQLKCLQETEFWLANTSKPPFACAVDLNYVRVIWNKIVINSISTFSSTEFTKFLATAAC